MTPSGIELATFRVVDIKIGAKSFGNVAKIEIFGTNANKEF